MRFIAHLLSLVGTPQGRPAIIAVDGRGGSGKTTLTTVLTAAVPGAQAFHLDDLIWNEPLYDWDQLYVDTLTRLREAGSLDLVPDKVARARTRGLHPDSGRLSPGCRRGDRGRSARGQQPH